MKSYFAVCSLALTFVLGGPANHAKAEDNGLGSTPLMGWSSWSFYRHNPTEAATKAEASAMINLGLAAHGYEYVNVDEGYYIDPASTVDGNGRWATDPSKFPDGFAALAAYVHNLGLKFGMYVTPGIPVAAYNQNTPIAGTPYRARDIVSDTTHFATNYGYFGGDTGAVMYNIDYTKPGAQAFINSWANLLASYGVDYLKLDGVGDGTEADIQAWSQALRQTGRPMWLELSNTLDPSNGAFWREYANGWRISYDIDDYDGNTLTDWDLVAVRFSLEPEFTAWAGKGAWNDLDSVELGNGANDGLTAIQKQTMETLWAISCSPFIIGADLTNMDAGDLALLTNDAILAIDQGGVLAAPLTYNTTTQVWRAARSDGSYTVALFNLGTSSATVSVTWQQLGFSGAATVSDVWAQTNLGSMNTGFSATLAPYASQLLRVMPSFPVSVYFADATGNTVTGSAVISQSTVDLDGSHAGYLGMGGTATFNNITESAAGTYKVSFMYANGDSVSRTAYISVNGGTPIAEAFPPLGNWNTEAQEGTMVLSLPLNAGANSITISGNPNAYAPDFDALIVQANSTSPNPPAPVSTPTLPPWGLAALSLLLCAASASSLARKPQA